MVGGGYRDSDGLIKRTDPKIVNCASVIIVSVLCDAVL